MIESYNECGKVVYYKTIENVTLIYKLRNYNIVMEYLYKT